MNVIKKGILGTTILTAVLLTGCAGIGSVGGIKNVTIVEYKVDNILGVYATYCTIVTGS